MGREELARRLNQNAFMSKVEREEFHRMYGFWENVDTTHAVLELSKCSAKWYCANRPGDYLLTLWRGGKEIRTFRYPDCFSINEKILYGFVEGEA